MSKIVQASRKLNLPEEKLLGDYIVTIPGFTLDKYRKLQRSRLSIISISCFGGAISHTLGLPFLSPFINMCLEECDYLRFLCSPRVHMAEKLVFKETCFEKNLKINYPVFTLDDVELHMNHYRDFDEAVKSWERRKARINWYNLFVMMFTDSEETLAEFDTLPYGKKVCFVPFKSDLDSAFYVNPKVDKTEPEFGLVINNFGNGRFFYYDPFDMLLYGKKTQLIDM